MTKALRALIGIALCCAGAVLAAAPPPSQTRCDHRRTRQTTLFHYRKFCEHFANGEYGSMFISYCKVLRGIHATFSERRQWRQAQRHCSAAPYSAPPEDEPRAP